MSSGKIVVAGATCKCMFGNTEDTLVVNTQQKHYSNDDKGSKKQMASTMDIGQPLQAKTFGQCKLMPTAGGFLPCVPAIVTWMNPYEKVVLENGGQVLTEKSKAICAIGGMPSIEFTWDGQTNAVDSSNVTDTDDAVMQQLNPLVNMKAVIIEEVDDLDAEDVADEPEEESEYTLESSYIHDHFKSVAKEITEEFEHDTQNTSYQLYKNIVDGQIPNPSIVVSKTGDDFAMAIYDTATEEIKVKESHLIGIQDDNDRKLQLIKALTSAYETYINSKIDIQNSVEPYEYHFVEFDGENNPEITFGKLRSPLYKGELKLDFSEFKHDLKDNKNENVEDYETYLGRKEGTTEASTYFISFLIKFKQDVREGFKVDTYIRRDTPNKTLQGESFLAYELKGNKSKPRLLDLESGKWIPKSKYNKKHLNFWESNSLIDIEKGRFLYKGETTKEKKQISYHLKNLLRSQFANSKEFRDIFKILKNSDKEYRFSVGNSFGYGQFSKTYATDINISPEFDDDGNETNIEEQKTNPDRAGGDIYISKEAWNDPSLAHHVIVEEMIHAAQFDNTISLEDARKFRYEKAYTVDSTGNREFEAKMLVGIINYQSGIPQYKTRQDETGYAQRFGVYFYLHLAGKPNASIEYFRHLDKWKDFSNSIGSNYGKFGFDKTLPSILNF